MKLLYKLIKGHIANLFLKHEQLYFFYLRLQHGVSKPQSDIEAPSENGVLKERHEWTRAIEKIKKAGLYTPRDLPKHGTAWLHWALSLDVLIRMLLFLMLELKYIQHFFPGSIYMDTRSYLV